eukprot:2000515-Lingulodinium_polyedra.AAC.1
MERANARCAADGRWQLLGCCLGADLVLPRCCLGAAETLLGRCLGAAWALRGRCLRTALGSARVPL